MSSSETELNQAKAKAEAAWRESTVNALLAKTPEVSTDLILESSLSENFELFRALFKKRNTAFELKLKEKPFALATAILSKIGVVTEPNSLSDLKTKLEARWIALDEEFSQDKEKTLVLILAMLEEGADLNLASTASGKTPLHWIACYPELAHYIPTLILHGASVDSSDIDGNRPLHLAAKHNNTGIDQLESKKEGTLRRAKNKEGKTPLHIAAEEGNLEVLKKLMEKRIRIDEKDNQRRTPLLLAIRAAKFSVISEILLHMEKTNEQENNNLLEEAIKGGNSSFCETFYKLLIEKKFVVTENPLCLAIKTQNLLLAQELMKNPYLNQKNALDETPLTLAMNLIPENRYFVALVNARADLRPLNTLSLKKLNTLIQITPEVIKAQDIDGNTLLHRAVIAGDLEQIQLLLNESPDLILTNNLGETAFTLAVKTGSCECIKLFIKKDKSLPLLLAPNMQSILARVPNYPAWKSGNLFHLAVEQSQLEDSDGNLPDIDVIKAYCKPSLTEVGWKGYTVLHLAALDPKKWVLLKKLIGWGGSPQILDEAKKTALYYASSAVTEQNVQSFRELLQCCLPQRLDVATPVPDPTAAFDYAVTHNLDLNLVGCLINENAFIYKRLVNGKTPIEQALENKNWRLVSLLNRYGCKLDLPNPKIPSMELPKIEALQNRWKKDRDALIKGLDDSPENIQQLENEWRSLSGAPILVKKELIMKLLKTSSFLDITDQDGNNASDISSADADMLLKEAMTKAIEAMTKGKEAMTEAKEAMTAIGSLYVHFHRQLTDNPLNLAIKEKKFDLAKELMKGPCLNLFSSVGKSTIRFAMNPLDREYFYDLIKAGVDLTPIAETINTKYTFDETLLHSAVRNQNLDFAKRLLSVSTIDVNACDQYGNTPLHYAVQLGNFKMVEALMTRGPWTSIRNKQGMTPKSMAQGENRAAVLDLLQRRGRTPHAVSTSYPNFYERVQRYQKLGKIVTKKNVERIWKKCKSKNQIELTDPDYVAKDPKKWWKLIPLIKEGGFLLRLNEKYTPLWLASFYVTSENLGAFRELLQSWRNKLNPQVTISDSKLVEEFDFAITHGLAEPLVDCLINEGALIHEPLKSGLTPIHQALDNKNLGLVKLLCSYGAKLNIEDPVIKKSLLNCSKKELSDISKWQKDWEKAKKLAEKKLRGLWEIHERNEAEVFGFVKHGVDLNLQARSGRSLLALAKDRRPELTKKFRALHEGTHQLQSKYKDKTYSWYKSVDQSRHLTPEQQTALKKTYGDSIPNIKVNILEAVRKNVQLKKTTADLSAAKSEWKLKPEYLWLKEHRFAVRSQENTRSVDAFNDLFSEQLKFINDQSELKKEDEPSPESEGREPGLS